MNKGYSTEMISTNFSIGWLYVGNIRRYLNDIIENQGWPVKYEEKVRFLSNEFTLYGNQRDLVYIQSKIQHYLNNLEF